MLKTSRDLTNESVKLIAKFKSGELKPIETGIGHLDNALLGGLLPGTVVGIVARSGHGKTYDAERISENILDNHTDIIYLHCNWEMSHFKLLVRDISHRTGENVKQVLFDPLTEDNTEKFKEICDIHRSDNVYYQNEPVSSITFTEDVHELIEKYPNMKIVATIDNLENVLRTSGSQKDCMDALLYEINVLKNKHSFISFIILNQMNQNYLLRMDNIKNQRPLESDVYGSDQLLKLCDVLYVKMIPWKLGLREKFMIFGENQYDWLEEHKLEGNGSTQSFDPFGRSFYFYLKNRIPEDEKNIQDLFIEQMFKRDETNYVEPKKPENPIFTQEPEPKFNAEKYNITPKEAFDMNVDDVGDDDVPF